MTLGTNNAERVRIDSSGNIGIGVTNPGDYWYQAEKLVVANTSGNSGATILASTSGTSNIAFADGISGDTTRRGVVAYYHSDDSMRFNTAGDNERLRITSTGLIQAGDSRQGTAYFNIYTTDVDKGIDLIGNVSSGNQNSSSPKIRFQGYAQTNGAYIQGINENAYGRKGLGFFTRRTANDYTTDPLESLRINSSGYVGIGTDNPGYKLDVRPTPSDPTSGSPPAGAFLQIRADDATVGNGPSLVLSNFGGSKETAWRISAVSTSGNNGDLVFNGYAGGATYPEAARFTSAGNLKFPSGQGIDFSATSDGSGTASSEILDDYEEGTWTPAVSFGGGTTGQTYARQLGMYTKIGNLVHIKGTLYFSNKGTSTGVARLIGLPYNVSGTAGAFSPIADRGQLNIGTGFVGAACYLATNATNLNLYKYRFDGGGNSPMTNSDFQNSSEIDVNFSYQIQ